MPFQRVFAIYLGLAVALPAVLAYVITGVPWTVPIGVVVGFMLANGPLQPLLDVLVRVVGDTSEGALLNFALRFSLTSTREKTTARLRRIAPRANVDALLQRASAAALTIFELAERIDKAALDEGTAKEQARDAHPFLDEGNLDWLDALGRNYLRRRAARP